MYVIGGGSFEPEGPDLDVYRLHLAGPKALEWERVRPSGTPPRCRAAHGLAWDRVGRAAYIWGGFTSGMELDSTFCALCLPPPVPSAAKTEEAEPRAVTVLPASSTPPTFTVIASNAATSFSVAKAGEAAAAAAIDEIWDPAGLTAAGNRSIDNHPRLPTCATLATDKHTSDEGGEEGRALPARTELVEQQQCQQQQQSPLPSQEDESIVTWEGHGQERVRRTEQRLWRQDPGEAGVRNESHDRTNRARRPWGNSSSHRQPWGQGWDTGGLQRFWGEAGNAHSPHPPFAIPPHLPFTATSEGATGTPETGGAGAVVVVPISHSVAPGLHHSQAHQQDDQQQATSSTAKTAVAGEEPSWVSLPSRSSGQEGGGEGSSASSPAGRSFHCAFFHGGACYVTGGSDGARKFGDMWRFYVRHIPLPLATLAARALVAQGVSKKKEGGGSGDGGVVSRVESKRLEVMFAGLPEELREALANINLQAEVVL